MKNTRPPGHPEEVFFDEKDLNKIRSYAVGVMEKFVPEMESSFEMEHIRTMCYVEAVVAHLRSKELIPFAVYFNQKRK